MSWCMIVCVSCVCMSVMGQDLTVSVEQGQLQGTILFTDKNRDVYTFYNVPYARPPIGEFRFKEPEEAEPWTGVRNATAPGNACLQHVTQSFLITGVEDCLYLNVFTPVLPNISAVPPWFSVIVFFHNGVFITGDSNMYRPTYLLDEDVVLVTANYRLGVLGFLSTEDSVVPGNNGLKDQVAVLTWVQRNIQAFGGDKDRVTIAGNTAGAVSVHLHFLSPLSVGLFQQGIAQSGSALVPWAITENLRQKAEFIAVTLNCSIVDSQVMIDCLRTFPPQQLILFTQTYEVFINTPFAPFGPCVEREGKRPFLTDYPFNLLQNRSALDRPIMFSDCENEGLYPLAGIINNVDDLDFLDRRWTDVAPYLLNYNETVSEDLKPLVSQEIRDYYINGSITNRSDLNVVRLFGDRQFLADNGRAAALHAKSNFFNSVYFYQFTFRGTVSNSQFYSPLSLLQNYGAANGDDILYILQDTRPFFDSISSQRDQAMRDFMVKLWASFAISGVPNVGNVTWTPVTSCDFDNGTLRYLEIASSDTLQMVTSIDFGNHTFWSSLPFNEPESGRDPQMIKVKISEQ